MNKYKFYLCGMTPEKWNAMLQELIYRKVLDPINVGPYKEFELKRKYKNRDKPINFDGVLLLHNGTQN